MTQPSGPDSPDRGNDQPGFGYATPGYGHPQEAYPPYGPPGATPYAPPGAPPFGPPGPAGWAPPPGRPTNTMAILALVFGFVFAPLGIVFGIIARRQIGRTQEGGDGLALAGIIVGAVFTVLFVAYIVFIVAVLSSMASTGYYG